MSEAKELDQFYTKSSVAKKYYDLLDNKYGLNDYFLFEPSAGLGSFSDLFHNDFLASDLSPKKDYMVKKDFFEIDKKYLNTNKPIFTIGNPPFGKNSSLAIKFINQSAEYSEYIAFILPKTFKKNSTLNKISDKLHLIFEEDLDKNSFIHEDQDYDVPCVFQIWKKEEHSRIKIKLKTTTNLFDFCSKEEADFAIRRVGGLAGKVLIDFEQYKAPSHYYINVKDKSQKDYLIEKLKECYVKFQEIAKNTAGNPSLSKGELIEIIEKSI
jgi:hypothetical protein